MACVCGADPGIGRKRGENIPNSSPPNIFIHLCKLEAHHDVTDCALRWYAVKTAREFEAERILSEKCSEVYLPQETVPSPSGRSRRRPIIPRLLFIRTTAHEAVVIERQSRDTSCKMPPIWIYRYERGGDPQPVTDDEMRLVKLLTAADSTKCDVVSRIDYRRGTHVRVTMGTFAGYEGYVLRIRKDRRVLISIQGICILALPFIHPDMLEVIE